MSRLFRHKSLSARISSSSSMSPDYHHSESGYSSLLESNVNVVSLQQSSPHQQQQHRRSKSSSLINPWGYAGFTMHHQETASRPWLITAESRTSWNSERPPPRKLVKDQNGSGRPSFSLELSDSDGENKEKGIVRRQIDRFRGLYRGNK